MSQRRITKYDRTLEHFRLIAKRLKSVVSTYPNTLLVPNLALASLGSATRTVPLVFYALGLGAQIRNVGKRTIATVSAVVHRNLRCLFEHVGKARKLLTLFKLTVNRSGRVKSRCAFRQHEVVSDLTYSVLKWNRKA